MARHAMLVLGLLGVRHGAAADSDSDPLKILNDEIEATKHFVEPIRGLVQELGRGLAAAEKAPVAPASPHGATLKLESQATSVVRPEAPLASEPATLAKASAAAQSYDAQFGKAPEAQAKDATQLEKAETQSSDAQLAKAAVAAADGQEAGSLISSQERRRIWSLLQTQTYSEMILLSKLAAPARLGATLDAWCNDAASPAACKFENNMAQYCQLIRRAAPALVDSVTLSTVVQGLLESEVAPGAAPVAASLLQLTPGSADDASVWGEVTRSDAFRLKVAEACEGIESAHPGCRDVAKEVTYCRAVGQAALTLADADALADKMAEAFSANPSLQKKRG